MEIGTASIDAVAVESGMNLVGLIADLIETVTMIVIGVEIVTMIVIAAAHIEVIAMRKNAQEIRKFCHLSSFWFYCYVISSFVCL